MKKMFKRQQQQQELVVRKISTGTTRTAGPIPPANYIYFLLNRAIAFSQFYKKIMSKKVSTSTVFHYIPNYIGYLRVVTAIVSFQLMREYPLTCTVIYSISCLLDALDGYAARKYNQTSRFGAVLDMVTDRCTTSSLICFLCVLYPGYALIFQLLVSLDLASHYMHMYATLQTGGKSHKSVDKQSSWLLNLYYTNRAVLFTMCAFNEVFYVALYLYHFPQFVVSLGGYSFSLAGVVAAICFPCYCFKQFTNVIQLKRAAVLLAELDVQDLDPKDN